MIRSHWTTAATPAAPATCTPVPLRRTLLLGLMVLYVCLAALLALAPASAQAYLGLPSSNPAWEWVSPAQGAESPSSVTFINEDEGWAVGGFQGVRHTVDGGLTWTATRFGPPLGSLGVFFADTEHGWIVGQGNDSYGFDKYTSYIWATSDGGATWHHQLYLDESHVPEYGGLGSVWFSDTQNGWAAGRATKLFHTTDGGVTWDRIEGLPFDETEASFVDFVAMQWLDAHTGFVLGNRVSDSDLSVQTMLVTTDGGAHWTRRELPAYDPNDANALFSIFFVDAAHGYVAGWNGSVYSTEDGGVTWDSRRLPSELGLEDVTALYFADATHGLAAGATGFIARTTDGGVTWETAYNRPGTRLVTLTPLHGATMLATGELGYNLRSHDAGATWAPDAPDALHPGARSLHFSSETDGWMVAQMGLLRSVDAGATWAPVALPDSGEPVRVRFLGPDAGWVTTETGQVLRTINGGATWQAIDTGTGVVLRDVFFTDDLRGWAVGEDGTIVASVDGGVTWTERDSGTDAELNTVFFLTDTIGWAAGTSTEESDDDTINTGWIATTTDGGATWTAHRFSDMEQSSVSQVFFTNPTNGFALGTMADGYGGMRGLFRTADGGSTWEFLHMFPFPPDDFVLFASPTNESLLLIGGHGILYSSVDGGRAWTMHIRPNSPDAIVAVSFVDEHTGYAVTSMGAVLKTTVGGAVEHQLEFDVSGRPPSTVSLSIANTDEWFHDFYVVAYDAQGRIVEDSQKGTGANLWIAAGDTLTTTLADLFTQAQGDIASLVVYTGEDVDLDTIARVSISYTWTDVDAVMLIPYGLTERDLARISQGYPDGTWRPSLEISRAQFVKMAVEAYGIAKASPATPTFSDVTPTDPYYPFIEGAVAAGLIHGSGQGLFNPHADTTREQGAAIMARWLARLRGIDLPTHYTDRQAWAMLFPFDDRGAISVSLLHELAYATELGIVRGVYGHLHPGDLLWRVQGAAMLTRGDGMPPA